MQFYEAIRLALNTIRVQKLKSFFTLLGVTIGVMFLIAVVSIVEGMSKYVEEDFAGRILGANTFTLRRYPWFGNNVTEAEWREWQRRPRVFHADVEFIKGILPTGTKYAVESQERLYAGSQYVSREKLLPGNGGKGTAPWRDRLFATMARNAGNAADFFNLPANRVVELGTRVEI